MLKAKILITSDNGQVTADLVNNETTRALVQMLPLTIKMHDHLRQEKTGDLPSPLPELDRQLKFTTGMLGLWGKDDFVIYYRNGRVPQPGIIVLGHVTGDIAIFDSEDPMIVRVRQAD